ncbi:hypothetical protein V6N13_026168 [Hibiscus sabdariffa]
MAAAVRQLYLPVHSLFTAAAPFAGICTVKQTPTTKATVFLFPFKTAPKAQVLLTFAKLITEDATQTNRAS